MMLRDGARNSHPALCRAVVRGVRKIEERTQGLFNLIRGLWRVGPRSLVNDRSRRQRCCDHWAFIGRVVVGHDQFDGDAMAFKLGKNAVEEGCGVFLALAWQ